MMRRIIWTALCWSAIVLVAVTVARAQSLGEAAQRAREQQKTSGGSAFKLDNRDMDPRLAGQEVLDYEVNAERWRRFLAAQIWVNQVLDKDAALVERLAALKTQTARSLERAIGREPALVKALAAAGSDAHDFAFTQVALTVAMLLNQDDQLVAAIGQPPAATQANMLLVKAHERELKEMQAVAAAIKSGMEKE